MRYTFTSFWKNGNRRDICARIQSIPPNVFYGEGYVVVSDNLGRSEDVTCKTQEELDELMEQYARAHQWSSESEKIKDKELLQHCLTRESVHHWEPFNALETDIHVKEGPSQASLSMTLGQLKLEDNNVKTLAASSKPRTAAIPPIAIMAMGTAMQTGADKYEAFNWRDTSVTASVFYNAMMRHLLQWFSGENHASDSNTHHLAHLMAGAAIILDAEMNGVFNDDRPKGVPLGDDYEKFFKR